MHAIDMFWRFLTQELLLVLGMPVRRQKRVRMDRWILRHNNAPEKGKKCVILTVHELGDHQASQVADYLLCTLRGLDPAIIPQYMLLRNLPPQVQNALASSEADDVEKLVKEADRILDFHCPSGTAVFSPQHPTPLLFAAQPLPPVVDNNGSDKPLHCTLTMLDAATLDSSTRTDLGSSHQTVCHFLCSFDLVACQ